MKPLDFLSNCGGDMINRSLEDFPKSSDLANIQESMSEKNMLALFAILSDSFRLAGASLQNSDVSTFSPQTSYGSGVSVGLLSWHKKQGMLCLASKKFQGKERERSSGQANSIVDKGCFNRIKVPDPVSAEPVNQHHAVP